MPWVSSGQIFPCGLKDRESLSLYKTEHQNGAAAPSAATGC